MNNQSSVSVSSGFVVPLTLLFVALKLTGYITWSWWWVLSPIWITAALVIGILLAVAVVVAARK